MALVKNSVYYYYYGDVTLYCNTHRCIDVASVPTQQHKELLERGLHHYKHLRL